MQLFDSLTICIETSLDWWHWKRRMRTIAKISIFANELNNEVSHHQERLHDHESDWLTAIWCYQSRFWDSRLKILNDVSIEHARLRFWRSSSFQNARSHQYNIWQNDDDNAQCTSQLNTLYNLRATDCICSKIDLTSREILDSKTHTSFLFISKKNFFMSFSWKNSFCNW